MRRRSGLGCTVSAVWVEKGSAAQSWVARQFEALLTLETAARTSLASRWATGLRGLACRGAFASRKISAVVLRLGLRIRRHCASFAPLRGLPLGKAVLAIDLVQLESLHLINVFTVDNFRGFGRRRELELREQLTDLMSLLLSL